MRQSQGAQLPLGARKQERNGELESGLELPPFDQARQGIYTMGPMEKHKYATSQGEQEMEK